MPKIVFLPHQDLCPDGIVVEAETGETILDAALRSGIEIEHACEKSCACTTCHCIVREGFDSLAESSEDEDDMLDKAWGLEPDSRLSCQARVTDEDLVVEIPRYTINHARELTRISTRKPFALPTCISGFAIWKSLMMIQTHPMKKFSRRFC